MTNTREIFYKAIIPAGITCSIFGAFPVSFHKNSIKVSYFKIFYGFCLSTSIAGVFCYRLLFTPKGGVDNLILKFAGIAYPVIIVGSWWMYLCEAKSLSKLFNDVFYYSNFLKYEKFVSRMFWILSGQLIVLISLAMSFNVRNIVHYPHVNSDPFEILCEFLDFLLSSRIALLTFQQINFLFFMHKLFMFFNRELGCVISRKIFTPRNKYLLIVKNVCENSKNFPMDIESLQLLHEKIFETCETLDSVFGAAASSSAAHSLIQITLHFYFFVIGLTDSVASSLRIILVVIELWILCFSCELVVKEVSQLNFLSIRIIGD